MWTVTSFTLDTIKFPIIVKLFKTLEGFYLFEIFKCQLQIVGMLVLWGSLFYLLFNRSVLWIFSSTHI